MKGWVVLYSSIGMAGAWQKTWCQKSLAPKIGRQRDPPEGGLGEDKSGRIWDGIHPMSQNHLRSRVAKKASWKRWAEAVRGIEVAQAKGPGGRENQGLQAGRPQAQTDGGSASETIPPGVCLF